ncbi:MAG TPA: ComEA family DNA-binding protein [Pseudonocardiaceae bacterium]
MVSVVGRVARPGLVKLSGGSRVADAIAAAGGALPAVDLSTLNLAQKLSDGEQIYVGIPVPPGAGGSVVGSTGDGSGPADASGGASGGSSEVPSASGKRGKKTGKSAGSGKVNLNTASADELESLPGVGPTTAQKIITWRTQHGRFSSVDELREVGGIGDTKLAALRDLVTT